MTDSPNRPMPGFLQQALDASVRDLASAAVTDAGAVQSESRKMLADYDRANPVSAARSRTDAA